MFRLPVSCLIPFSPLYPFSTKLTTRFFFIARHHRYPYFPKPFFSLIGKQSLHLAFLSPLIVGFFPAPPIACGRTAKVLSPISQQSFDSFPHQYGDVIFGWDYVTYPAPAGSLLPLFFLNLLLRSITLVQRTSTPQSLCLTTLDLVLDASRFKLLLFPAPRTYYREISLSPTLKNFGLFSARLLVLSPRLSPPKSARPP